MKARVTGIADAQLAFDAATQALGAGLAGAGDDYDRALERWMATGAADFDSRVDATLDQLGLPPRIAEQPTSSLSGGEAARVGLAASLLSKALQTNPLIHTELPKITGDLAMFLAVLRSWNRG